jgi:hypothetical protein
MTTTFTSFTSAPTPAVRTRRAGRIGRAGLTSGVAAALANVGIVAAARGLDVAVEIQHKAIPLLGFAQVTLFAAIIGIGMAAVFARRVNRPRHTFVVTSVVLTAVSMMPPAIVDAEISTKLVLGLTHVVAALVVIPALAARLTD